MFDLYVADQERLTETNTFPDSERCAYEPGTVKVRKDYECNMRGRYVAIVRRTRNRLTVCEVQVWGKNSMR